MSPHSLATLALLLQGFAKTIPSALDLPAEYTTCLFWEDFSDNPGTLPSTNKWNVDVGTSYPDGPPQWGTGEVQTYTNLLSNIAITGHNTLKITPRKSPDGNWTSARIETKELWDFGCEKGQRLRVQARIRLGHDPAAKQNGIWPAFWLIGSAIRDNYMSWPAIGEVDILENLNGQRAIHHTLHCGVAPGGPCNEFAGIGNTTVLDFRDNWHDIAWEVDRRETCEGSYPQTKPESMTFFVDGIPHWTFTEDEMHEKDEWLALAANKKMIVLNVAVGGSFPDAVAGFETPTNATLGGDGAAMEVAYVGVFRQ